MKYAIGIPLLFFIIISSILISNVEQKNNKYLEQCKNSKLETNSKVVQIMGDKYNTKMLFEDGSVYNLTHYKNVECWTKLK